MTKKKSDVVVRRVKLEDIGFDQDNANLGTLRGAEVLDRSLDELGAGRSVVLDKNLVTIGGEKTQIAYRNNGGENVILVETQGDELVAVVRTDLDLYDEDDRRGRLLSIIDNWASQISLKLDPKRIVEEYNKPEDVSGLNLSGYVEEDEIESFRAKLAADVAPDDFPEYDDDLETEHRCPKCGYEWSGRSD